MQSEKNRSTEKFYKTFRNISIYTFRIGALFLIIFNVVYFYIVAARALVLSLIDPLAAFFDFLVGTTVISILLIILLSSHSRVGAFLSVLDFIYWAFVPSNWIILDIPRMQVEFPGTFHTMWFFTILFLGIGLLGLLNVILETVYLGLKKRSLFWGPWFSFPTFMPRIGSLNKKQKKAIKLGALLTAILVGGTVPGLLVFSNGYRVPVTIKPGDYNIKFNFWASPDLANDYNQSIIQELNEHRVNLDIMINRVNTGNIGTLIAFENAIPNITYRVTMYAPEIAELPNLVKEATETIMAYEQNGTLDQWRGFVFDIEGYGYLYNNSYDKIEDNVAMWNELFDWIDQKSIERGSTIEMECVNVYELAVDYPFDHDLDQQKHAQLLSYYPERFTLYAPMVYRCWYQGDKPFGSEMDPLDPWPTSYEVYSSIYTLKQGIPDEKLGVYLGITNCSCYGRDLPQNEPYSWPGDQENSGLYNLARDVLICKHFGIKEVTFFLLWTVIENEYSMGGVFDAYGIDFLDWMNSTVNTNPPDEFVIYFNYNDAATSEDLRYDWVYDFSRPVGMLQVFLMGSGAILGIYFLKITGKLLKKKERVKTNKNKAERE
ncbi:MAG: hypothetical protein ACTSRA_04455 [Promethearchaeota archaeon]